MQNTKDGFYSVRFYNKKGKLYSWKKVKEEELIGTILADELYDESGAMYACWYFNEYHYEVWQDGKKLADSRRNDICIW